MILTITPNTGLDRTVFLDRLRPGVRNQARAAADGLGGKGCCVSLTLARLGEPTTAIGLAAGEIGRRVETMLRAAGAATDFVWTAGESRLNLVLIEANGRHTTICAEGLRADAADAAALCEAIRRHARDAAAIVVAGSAPATWPLALYEEVVRTARQATAPLVIDAAGDALECALRHRPAGVKPNRDELAAAVGRPLRTIGDAIAAARELHRRGASSVLASLGAHGALLVTEEGVWRAPAIPVPVCSPAGAGDAMTAALALGLAQRMSPPTILRLATALAAAAVQHPATGDLDPVLVPKLRRHARIRRIRGPDRSV